jgi:hypothetical protein
VKTSMLLIMMLTFMAATNSFASDYGVVIGVRSDSATSNNLNTQINSNTDYMAGVVGVMDAFSQFQLRSGFLYTTRSYGYIPQSGASGTATFSSLDVPVGLLWKMSDYGGPFLGANVALNVSSSCPGGTCTGLSSMPVGLQLGAQFKFAPQFGAAIYYESMGPLGIDIDSPKAAVGQLLITF